MGVRRATSMWKVMMNPHDIEIEDISNIFFDNVLGVTNMSYFKSQKLVFDRHEKERELIVLFVKIEGRNLEARWWKRMMSRMLQRMSPPMHYVVGAHLQLLFTEGLFQCAWPLLRGLLGMLPTTVVVCLLRHLLLAPRKASPQPGLVGLLIRTNQEAFGFNP